MSFFRQNILVSCLVLCPASFFFFARHGDTRKPLSFGGEGAGAGRGEGGRKGKWGEVTRGPREGKRRGDLKREGEEEEKERGSEGEIGRGNRGRKRRGEKRIGEGEAKRGRKGETGRRRKGGDEEKGGKGETRREEGLEGR